MIQILNLKSQISNWSDATSILLIACLVLALPYLAGDQPALAGPPQSQLSTLKSQMAEPSLAALAMYGPSPDLLLVPARQRGTWLIYASNPTPVESRCVCLIAAAPPRWLGDLLTYLTAVNRVSLCGTGVPPVDAVCGIILPPVEADPLVLTILTPVVYRIGAAPIGIPTVNVPAGAAALPIARITLSRYR